MGWGRAVGLQREVGRGGEEDEGMGGGDSGGLQREEVGGK